MGRPQAGLLTCFSLHFFTILQIYHTLPYFTYLYVFFLCRFLPFVSIAFHCLNPFHLISCQSQWTGMLRRLSRSGIRGLHLRLFASQSLTSPDASTLRGQACSVNLGHGFRGDDCNQQAFMVWFRRGRNRASASGERAGGSFSIL